VRNKLIMVLGTAFLLALLSVGAQAQKYYTYGERTLIPYGFEDWALYYSYQGGAYVNSTTSEYSYFIPVEIPDGEIVRYMRLIYYDNAAETYQYLDANFYRINMWTGVWEKIYGVDTKGVAADLPQTKVDLSPEESARTKIINSACSYVITVYFNYASSDLRFIGVVLVTY